MLKILIFIYLILNLLLFVLYGVDKRKAIKDRWRIQESTLLIIGLISGGVGGLLGQLVWHHKTRKFYFWLVNILALCLHIAVICLVYRLAA